MAGKKGLSKMAAHVGPNMTPMVDIVMCILIFFMLSMTFAGAELFLKSDMIVSKTGLDSKQSSDVIDMPEFTIRIRIVPIDRDPNRPEAVSSIRGAGIVSRDHELLRQPIRVGRPDLVDTIEDDSTRERELKEELKLNKRIADTLKEMHDRLKAKGKAIPNDPKSEVLIVLEPDNFVPYEDVIKVYDACVDAEFAKVAFAPSDTKSATSAERSGAAAGGGGGG